MNANAGTGPAGLRSSNIPPFVTGGLTALGLLGAIYASATGIAPAMPASAEVFMIVWLAVSTAVTFLVTPRSFPVGFPAGLLAMLIGWRIGGFYAVAVVWVPLLAAFVAFALQFFDCARADGRGTQHPALTTSDWHLTFLRVYIGFDMVPHFTEKLFAGPGPFMEDVKGFAGFGLPWPEAFVVVGGLCELGIAIGIGIGFLTRLAALGATLYFLIATAIGGHFGAGFIWVSTGGGWEYPVLMMVLYLSFAYRGAGRFSADGALIDAGRMPAALRICAVRRGAEAPHR